MTSISAVLRYGRSKWCVSSTDLARSTITSHALDVISRLFETLLRCLAHESKAKALQFVSSDCWWKLVKAARSYTCLKFEVMEKKWSWSWDLPDSILTISRWKLWIFWCCLFCLTIQLYLKDSAWSRIHQAWGPGLKARSAWRPGPKA